MALITVPALYRYGNCSQYHIINHQVSLIFDNRRPLVINNLAEIFNLLVDRNTFFTILQFLSVFHSLLHILLKVSLNCITKSIKERNMYV